MNGQGLCCDVRAEALSKHFKFPKISTGTLFLRKLQRVHKVPSGFQVDAFMKLSQQHEPCCGLWSTFLVYSSVATICSSLYAPTPRVTWSLTTYRVCLSVNCTWDTVRERDSFKNRLVMTPCVNQPTSVIVRLSHCDIPHTPQSVC